MSDMYRDATARAARLEEIARRREDIELKRLEREEQHLLALDQAQAVIRNTAKEPIDLTGDSPPPKVKQEAADSKWRPDAAASNHFRALQNDSAPGSFNQKLQITANGFQAARLPAPNSHPTCSYSAPPPQALHVACTVMNGGTSPTDDPTSEHEHDSYQLLPSTEGQDGSQRFPTQVDAVVKQEIPPYAQFQGRLEMPGSSNSPTVDPIPRAEPTSTRAPQEPISSDHNASERRTKKKRRRGKNKEEKEKDQSGWFVTDDPRYRTIVKAASSIPDEFVELRCYLCHGNFGKEHFISGPNGFTQHLKKCHPDEHPSKEFLSLKQVVELCGRPLSKDVVDGIVSKRGGRYRVPRIPAQKTPANSDLWRAVDASAASAAAKRKRKRSFDSSEGYISDEEDTERDSEVASGEMTRRIAISTRRSGSQLVWTKKMGRHPVAESDDAGDSDEE